MTQDIANLGIKVDTTPLKDGKVALDQYVTAGTKAEESVKRLSTSLAASRVTILAAATSAQAYIASLERQAATLGMNTQQLRAYEMAQMGLTKTQYTQATAHLAAISAYEKEQAIQKAAAQTALESAAAIKAQAAAHEQAAAATRAHVMFVGKMVAAYALWKTAHYISEATTLFARYETLGVSMLVVGRNAGYSAKQMNDATVAMQRTGISMLESRQQALRLVQAHIDLSNASKLARIAQDAAVIGNINSSEAFSRLVHGIQSGQTEILRGIGINVTMERSYKAMADQLGVTVASLTQAQRSQAVLNSVFREGAAIAGTYEAAMGTAGKQLLSMQRYSENLQLQLGETFNEALIIAVEAMTSSLKGMTQEAQDLATRGQLREWGRNMIRVAAAIVDGFALVKNTFVEVGRELGFMGAASNAFFSGEFTNLQRMLKLRSEDRAEFVNGIGAMQRSATARFELMDKQLAESGTLSEVTGKTKANTEAVTADAAAIKKAKDAYNNTVQAIREKIATEQEELTSIVKLNDAHMMSIKIKNDERAGDLVLTEGRRAQIAADLLALDTLNQLNAAKKFYTDSVTGLADADFKSIGALEEQIRLQKIQNEQIGMTNEEILSMVGAKDLELAANLRIASQYAGEFGPMYLSHAENIERIVGLQKELLATQQIEKASQQYNQMFQNIEQTGRMAFVQFAAHGTSAMRSIGQSIKMSIIDLLYQLTIRKWIINIGTSISSSFAGGMAQAAGGGLMGSLSGIGSSIMNIGSKGAMSAANIANAAKIGFSAVTGLPSAAARAILTSAAGVAMGTGVAGTAFGAGVGTAGAGAGTAFIGGAGTAIGGSGMGGAALSSVGMQIASMAGPLIALAVVDMAFRFIAGDKKMQGGVGKVLSKIPVIGPIGNALFGRGPYKPIGPQELVGSFGEGGFAGDLQTLERSKGGWFKKNRYRIAHQALSAESQAGLSGMVDTASVVFHDLILASGDAARSLAGWSFAIKRVVSSEEQMKALSLEVSASLGAKLVPELLAVQQKGELLADTAKRVRSEFILTNELIGLTGQSFGAVGLASVIARDNLVNLLGGVEKAGAPMQAFYQSFYTDAERNANGWRLLNTEMTNMGIDTLPTTRDEFRKLVEGQDLATIGGAAMTAALIQLAPVFASLTDNATAAAAAVQLSSDAFRTLVSYTRYVRLSQNATLPPVPALPSFAVGTDFVPRDMTADIHAGEAVLTAEENKARRAVGAGGTAPTDTLAAMIAVAINTGEVARLIRRWHGDGLPETRTTT